MNITRLGWAGLELEASTGETAVIDLFQNLGRMEQFIGPAHTTLPGPTRPGAATLALVTHLHEDHTDPAALAEALAPGGVLLRPERAEGEFLETAAVQPVEEHLAELGIEQRVVAPWEAVEVGPFRATAVPAVDGFGDPQVSWVVQADATRILHCGDTLFHGSWWKIRMRLGPIDIAFLPVNGALVSLPHRQPASTLPACMDPEQAAVAAAILEAGEAIPIHYDTLHGPPTYAQTDDPAPRFVAAAERLGVSARIVEPGAPVREGAVQRA